jgi:protein-S-isoprenylcysteine O-methyltransferase Ste14
VRVSAPAVFAGLLAAGVALERSPVFARASGPAPRVLGTVAILGGIALVGATAAELRDAGPRRLRTTGLFRFTRNPQIFGLTSIYLGAAIARGSVPAFVLLPIALALVDRFVVADEERGLDAAFGDAYRAYLRRTPRWF